VSRNLTHRGGVAVSTRPRGCRGGSRGESIPDRDPLSAAVGAAEETGRRQHDRTDAGGYVHQAHLVALCLKRRPPALRLSPRHRAARALALDAVRGGLSVESGGGSLSLGPQDGFDQERFPPQQRAHRLQLLAARRRIIRDDLDRLKPAVI